MKTALLAIAGVNLEIGGTARVEGDTTGREHCHGIATIYEAHGPDSVHMTLHDIAWDNGERDVRAVDRHNSPQRFDRLVHGLRLTVNTLDSTGSLLRADLRQARMVDELWAKPRQVNVDVLSAPIGQPIDDVLTRHGATAVGTRKDLLHDRSSHRNGICVLFPATAELVPMLAYLCTRIVPVLQRLPA